MKIIKHNPACLTLEIPSSNKEKLSMMLASDVHFDSAVCDIDLFTKHLKYAEETQSPVLIAGDLLDAMQGKHDPRSKPEDLKAKYKVSAYYDAIVIDAAKFLAGFDIPCYILALGNHETSVLTHSSTNLLESVAFRLRAEYKKKAVSMGYWGYLRVRFKYKRGSATRNKIIYWYHGISGNAPVTKGVIQVARQGVYLYSPDIVLNGHNHQAYTVPLQVERLNQRTMEPYTESIWYLRTPGYKKNPADSKMVTGFEPEKHRAPTPRGCQFVEFSYEHSASDDIGIEILQKII